MERRKLVSAALFLTVLGTLFFLPPLAVLFQLERRFLGVPLEVIYLFVCWLGLIAGAFWLGRRLPREAEAEPPSEGEN